MKKYKKYVITLSQVFPVKHIRKGEPTGFKDKFLAAIGEDVGDWLKLHTIRANYELWKKRFEEIEAGRACLCIWQWSGKPYCSKQVEIARLTREDGIGLQELRIVNEKYKGRGIMLGYVDGEQKNDFFHTLSKNDGLSFNDWLEWFKGYNFNKPLAIIHFTKFRY